MHMYTPELMINLAIRNESLKSQTLGNFLKTIPYFLKECPVYGGGTGGKNMERS